MRDIRRFLRRARAKCETFVVFGVVQARNAGHWSLLDSCRREMRDCRFCRDTAAILVMLVGFCLLNKKAL